MRKLLLAAPLVLMLGACEPDTVTKEKGQIIDMQVHSLKYGYSYDLIVSYPTDGGKYKLDSYDVDNKEKYDQYKVGQTVTIYENDNGIKEITK